MCFGWFWLFFQWKHYNFVDFAMVSSCASLKKHMFLHKIKRFYNHCMFFNENSFCYMNPCDFPMISWFGVGNKRHGQSAGCRNGCQAQGIRWCGQGFWSQKHSNMLMITLKWMEILWFHGWPLELQSKYVSLEQPQVTKSVSKHEFCCWS